MNCARANLSSVTSKDREPQPRSKMDPVTAVGFAASILNFVDFSWNLVQGTYEVYKSGSGATAENAQISTILEDLQEVTEGLHSDLKVGSKYAKQLSKLAKNCLDLSLDLTKILEKLRVKERNSSWQAAKVAWLSMRKEKEVASIEKRLGGYRSEIILRLNMMLLQVPFFCNPRSPPRAARTLTNVLL
jgi:hypothetical protein